jgi:hypothetical protein
VARFRQIDMDNPATHHDALEFPNGEVVLLTNLRPGQLAAVLQLPSEPKTAEDRAQPAETTGLVSERSLPVSS